VPFTVGGGISDVASAAAVLGAGANKISTSSAAFRKPQVIAEMLKEFGPEKVTVAIDVDQNPAMPSGYEVYIDGGRTATGADAVEWAKKVDGFGVPVILPTSKAGDGAKTGYDLPVIRAMKQATKRRSSPRAEPASWNTSTKRSRPAPRCCWPPPCSISR